MNNRKGLTLIELIVLLIIISFIIIEAPKVLLNILGRSTYYGVRVTCKTKLLQIGSASSMYYDDNNGSFSSGTSGVSDRDDWIISLRPYYQLKGGTGPLKCPMYEQRRPDGKPYGGPNNTFQITIEKEGMKEIRLEGSDNEKGYELWVEKENINKVEEESSYGLNCWIYNPPKDSSLFLTHPADNFWRTDDVSNASKVPLFADAMWVGGYPEPDGKAGEPPSENGQWDGVDAEMKHFCIDRHSGAINILFMDGHVEEEEVELKRLWKLKWHKNFDTNGKWTKPDAPWPKWMKDIKRD